MCLCVPRLLSMIVERKKQKEEKINRRKDIMSVITIRDYKLPKQTFKLTFYASFPNLFIKVDNKFCQLIQKYRMDITLLTISNSSSSSYNSSA